MCAFVGGGLVVEKKGEGFHPNSMLSNHPQISPGVDVELKSSISRDSASLNFPLKYKLRAVYIDSASHAFRWMMITAT